MPTTKYAQKITHFYCRPCAEYHPKTHPHYRAMKRRANRKRKARMAVQQELQMRLDEVDRMRSKQVERARYEADLAQRRYMYVDPANRLVADALEAEWNSKLRALNEAQEEYERLRQADRMVVDEAQKARIAALVSDFPRLWRDSADARSRKETHGSLTARGCHPAQA